MTMSLTKFLPVILLFGLIALIASPEGESKEAATPEEQIDWAAHNAQPVTIRRTRVAQTQALI